jgi:uncharacterized protein YqeY
MIQQKIQSDQIQALKAGDKKRLETLRYILAQIKNKEIEKREALSDDEVLNVLRKIIKELKESIESFEKANRTDLAAEYKAQYDVAVAYMPAEISDEELKKAVDDLKTKHNEVFMKNPKALIGICMKELRGKAEPARILKYLKEAGVE